LHISLAKSSGRFGIRFRLSWLLLAHELVLLPMSLLTVFAAVADELASGAATKFAARLERSFG